MGGGGMGGGGAMGGGGMGGGTDGGATDAVDALISHDVAVTPDAALDGGDQ